jgi:hypothetical protein
VVVITKITTDPEADRVLHMVASYYELMGVAVRRRGNSLELAGDISREDVEQILDTASETWQSHLRL